MKTAHNPILEMDLIQLWKNGESRNIPIDLIHKSLSDGTYHSELLGTTKKLMVKQKIVVFSQNLLASLNVAESKMVAVICKELKHNNALWYFEYRGTKGRDERTILTLRKKKILIKTDYKNYHLVNPFAIRMGGFPAVVASTLEYIRKYDLASKKSIPDLRPPKSFEADFFNYSNVIDFDYTLVDPFV